MHDADNAEVVAVASRTLEKAAAWAEKEGVPKAYGSYDELIAAEDIDVIYIPLPTAFKFEWAMKVAKAGKSMVLEKPLPGQESPAEMAALINACAENGVQFFDGSMWQHSLRTKRVDEVVAAGSLGKIQRVDASFFFPAPSQEFIDGGNGRTDKTREPWGCFGDQGWYPVSGIMHFAGYVLPKRVQMISVTLNKVDTVISSAGVMWFDDFVATFDCGCIGAHRSYVHAMGSKGNLLIEDLVGGFGKSGNLAAYAEHFTGSDYFKLDDTMGKEEIVKVDACNHTTEMVRDMSRCALGEKEDRWPKAALANHTVMAALWRSHLGGNAVVEL